MKKVEAWCLLDGTQPMILNLRVVVDNELYAARGKLSGPFDSLYNMNKSTYRRLTPIEKVLYANHINKIIEKHIK